MAYVYHYHTMHQLAPGSLVYNDGIVTCPLPIDSPERFAEIRQAIADEIGVKGPPGFNIASLTLLNPSI